MANEQDKPASPIKVAIRQKPESLTADKSGHTYIHFGGSLKSRFKVLATKAGYTRKLNDFGVMLFEQALALAEADFKSQTENEK
jgi:hypothetical protein